MTVDIATLAWKADTSDFEKVPGILDRAIAAAEKLERKVDELSRSVIASTGNTVKAFTDIANTAVAFEAAGGDARKALTAISVEAREAAMWGKSLDASLSGASRAAGEAGRTMGATAGATDKTARGMQQAAKAADTLSGSADRVAANMGDANRAGDKFEQTATQIAQKTTQLANSLEKSAQGVAEVSGNIDGFFSRISNALNDFGANGAYVSTVLGGMSLTLKGLVAYFSVDQVVNFTLSIARAGEAVRNLEAGITALTGSSERGAAALTGVREIANALGAQVAGVADQFTRFTVATSEMDIPQAELEQFVLTLGQLGSLGGSTMQEIQSASIQLSQGLAAGALQGQELLSVMEGMPLVAQAIADHLGVGRGELKELAKEGKLTADVVLAAILGQASDIQYKFSQMPTTMEQAANRLSNSWGRFLSLLDESLGVSKAIVGAIEVATNVLEYFLDKQGEAVAGAGKLVEISSVTSDIQNIEKALLTLEGAKTNAKFLALSLDDAKMSMASFLQEAGVADNVAKEAFQGVASNIELANKLAETLGARYETLTKRSDELTGRTQYSIGVNEEAAESVSSYADALTEAKDEMVFLRLEADAAAEGHEKDAARWARAAEEAKTYSKFLEKYTKQLSEAAKTEEEKARIEEDAARLARVRTDAIMALADAKDRESESTRKGTALTKEQVSASEKMTGALLSELQQAEAYYRVIVEGNGSLEEAELARRRIQIAQELGLPLTSAEVEEKLRLILATEEYVAATERELEKREQSSRAQEEYSRELARYEEQMRRFDTRPMIDAMNSVGDSIQDNLRDGFREALGDAKGFAGELLDILANLASDILRNRIIIPITAAIGGGFGIGSGAFGLPGAPVPPGGAAGAAGGAGGLGGVSQGLSFGSMLQGLGSNALGPQMVNAIFGAGGAPNLANFAGGALSGGAALGGIASSIIGDLIFGGGRGIGATAGNALGSMAGAGGAAIVAPMLGFAAGPIGLAIGALLGGLVGNGIGGLFGPKPPSNATGFIFDAESGDALGQFDPDGEFSEKSLKRATEIATQATAVFRGLELATGLDSPLRKIAGDSSDKRNPDFARFTEFQDNGKTRFDLELGPERTAAQAAVEVFLATMDDLSDDFRAALEKAREGGDEAITEAISAVEASTSITKALEDLTADPIPSLEAAFTALNDPIEETAKLLTEWGLSLDDLNEMQALSNAELRDGFIDGLERAARAVEGDSFLDEFVDQVEGFRDSFASIDFGAEQYGDEWAEKARSLMDRVFTGSLEASLEDLDTSDLSDLSDFLAAASDGSELFSDALAVATEALSKAETATRDVGGVFSYLIETAVEAAQQGRIEGAAIRAEYETIFGEMTLAQKAFAGGFSQDMIALFSEVDSLAFPLVAGTDRTKKFGERIIELSDTFEDAIAPLDLLSGAVQELGEKTAAAAQEVAVGGGQRTIAEGIKRLAAGGIGAGGGPSIAEAILSSLSPSDSGYDFWQRFVLTNKENKTEKDLVGLMQNLSRNQSEYIAATAELESKKAAWRESFYGDPNWTPPGPSRRARLTPRGPNSLPTGSGERFSARAESGPSIYDRRDSFLADRDALSSLAGDLRGALRSLTVGSTSSLLPEQKLAKLESEFFSTAAKAKRGDQDAARSLVGIAADLDAARVAYLGTATEKSVSLFERMQDGLQASASAQDRQIDLMEKSLSALERLVFLSESSGPVWSRVGGLVGSAMGNVFGPSGIVRAFARGGIVSRPTVFPFAEGTGLMGEAGPEAIMPLTRIGGSLGVRSDGVSRDELRKMTKALDGLAKQLQHQTRVMVAGSSDERRAMAEANSELVGEMKRLRVEMRARKGVA